jgi:hypothetical protein|tara:strand:- start:1399 stop:2553 length:1155 start_codon:yes stop_codon:yes gene_type:complete
MSIRDEIKQGIEANWHHYLNKYGNLFSSKEIQGSSPPSIFVGRYGYPKVAVGPMLPPVHGDTSILDMPEKWLGKSLEEIVNFRLNLIRGIKKLSVNQTEGRLIENLQEIAMSSNPTDTEIQFVKPTSPVTSIDDQTAPFGPIGEIKTAKFSSSHATMSIEKVYYDYDLKADDAIMKLYNSGIDISKIQKCLSIGMMGKNRKLVPTKWSITATDSIISKSLMLQILDFEIIDSINIFSFEHLGNLFAVILFPHRWIFEMQEAWHDGTSVGFGNDYEDAKGISHNPSIAGAFFAAKLAVAEYLIKKQKQAGILILREIQPTYAVPVGVWQIREGIREAMRQSPLIVENIDDAIELSIKKMSVSKNEWIREGKMLKLLQQKVITDFF